LSGSERGEWDFVCSRDGTVGGRNGRNYEGPGEARKKKQISLTRGKGLSEGNRGVVGKNGDVKTITTPSLSGRESEGRTATDWPEERQRGNAVERTLSS